jgi:hypothetical protein
MTAHDGKPDISIVIVSLGGLADLAIALPGLGQQTIASQIELIFVAGPGRITQSELLALSGFHSVRLVEKAGISNRGRDASAGIAVATAPYVGLHENHTRAEPETYERVLAAFDEVTGAVCPVIYAANSEMVWGRAMYSVAHGHSAPPVTKDPKPFLVLHSSVYRRDFLQQAGERLEHEGELQAELVQQGLQLKFVPGTVVWHVNEARPYWVVADIFQLARVFAFGRAKGMGKSERMVRALASPAIIAISVIRILQTARRSPESSLRFLTSIPVHVIAGITFGVGETIGYFDKKNPWNSLNELHEFHIRGRLDGRIPAKRWLAEAVVKLPHDAP